MRTTRVAVLGLALCVFGTLVGSGQATAEHSSESATDVLGVTPSGVTASYAVYDREHQRFTATRNPHEKFRSASVVKLLIALDDLQRNNPPLDLDQAKTDLDRNEILARRTMLRGSWDYAASYFWVKNGFTDIIDRMVGQIGLEDTTPPAKRGQWGYTITSASDTVKVYNYLLDRAPAVYRDFVIDNIHASTRCAEDSRDQSFGIPGGYARPWGVKQGWSGWGATVPAEEKCREGRSLSHTGAEFAGPLEASKEDPDLISPLLHTTGTVGPDNRAILVLFTTYPKDTKWPQGAATITRFAKRLFPFTPGAKPRLPGTE